ncbi:YhgE/Pip domain-containing protein [Couchioplanes azureus]|uniref:YhgE/Pip domain-containing protein n=1 Tax=Couchioplanes caeruleus TaxID=56438 RepID=UPI0016713E28|nr:YhgE/Pip domain-containing protein [Couchioplanes caeruleus]GGQ57957.1 membrane protein [Couchioplanes caeruleus subsp. azureus]
MTGTSSLRLAGFELRRFLRGRLPTAALVVICVIPLLYGALYLYAFWDPYGRLNHVPVALVVEDVQATATDGTKVHAGKDLADELIEREIFDWHVTDEQEAEEGLADGRYQLSLRIPRDFSTNLTTGPDADATPKPAQLIVINDDATNYLSGVFSRTVFDEVRAAAARSAQSGYFDKMLIGFTDLKHETQKAADGAHEIDNGATDLHGGAKKVEGGIDASEKGAGKIAGGLGEAAQGLDKLSSVLVSLKYGSAKVAAGTRDAANRVREVANTLDSEAAKFEPFLREHAQELETGANLVARGAELLAENVHRLDTAADEIVGKAQRLQQYLDGLPDTTEGIAEQRAAAQQLVTVAQRIRSNIDDADLKRWGERLREVARIARDIAKAAPHVADDIAKKRSDAHKFATALDKLAAGAKQVSDGNAGAAAGAAALRGGVFELASGARRLDDGLMTLSDGGRQLAKGLGDLRKGTDKLASGLSDGADKVPGYGDDPSDRADLLADPVRVDRTVRNPAATYGVGFAPYFLALALWVGAMITFMVLRPLNRRYVVSGAPPHRVVLAGLLPAVAIGCAQALLLFVVVVFGLGLGPHNPTVTLGLLMLTATAFAAIMQLVGAALGPAGRIIALALLMLQLTSSGGTYPVQTTPGFFQAIHPFLPMTYVVAALRHAIDGGSTGTVVTGALALLGYGSAALALTVAVALRKRRLTPSDLHPELVI